MKITQPLFDRINIPPKAEVVKFFQTPVGSSHKDIRANGKGHNNGNIATPLDTNMDMQGELWQKNYAIEGISFTSDIMADQEDVFNYIRRSWMQLTIDGINYLQLPAQFVYDDPDDFDINDPTFVWDDPVILKPGNKFYAALMSPKPGAMGRFDIYCVLHGYYFREEAKKAKCETPQTEPCGPDKDYDVSPF